ncbi:asparagine--tRNA ligase [Clostridium tepidiprofundi DSM 19306]|uniref:Aspartate--tRNA ligase n=1 Tax=Clostridium tepidiprofundi DSM 19306 TaxID=1121338 RepID=A0A151B514_9CLOT|nr:aspartate--tRNA(Asn) ligase [Clostridium tepidiprofundi]KYH34989.1 asparagine--tRNA ligase [Clostridium tepidiprofundi DSM 19306]
MNRVLVSQLMKHINEEVKISGWVHRIRKLGKIAFLLLRDRSGIVQCIVNTKEVDIKGIKLESVVNIFGNVVENSKCKLGVEIQLSSLEIISEVKEDLPIEVNKEEMEASLDAVLNNRVLSLRNIKINSTFRIQAVIAQAFGEFLKNEGFTQIFSSKIVSEGTEGGTELFKIKYFDREAYLAQSPQFYKQMMVSAGYERVFEIGHVYRAEKHDTKRHINEYVSLDLEMGFIEDEREIMELETSLLKYIFESVKRNCSKELESLNVKMPEIKDGIPTMKLSEAIDILKKKYNKIGLEKDLDPEGEALICEYVKEKYNSEFVFLTHYPQEKRPMYTMPAENGETHSFDLLFRGLEITTGGQRIHNYDMLKESMIKHGVNPKSFEGYLIAFKYGMPPHGGLAIGLERITAMLLGLENIREATLTPRDKNRLAP